MLISTGVSSTELVSTTTSTVEVAGEISTSVDEISIAELFSVPKSAGSTPGELSPRLAPSEVHPDLFFLDKKSPRCLLQEINYAILKQMAQVR